MHNRLISLIFFSVALFTTGTAGATVTRYWQQSSFAHLSKGKSKGVMVTSEGRVIPGMGYEQLKVTGQVPSFFRKIAVFRGKTYIFSGMPAAAWLLQGDKVTKVTELKPDMAVSAVAMCGGSLYVAAIPSGTVYTFDGKGFSRVAAVPEGYAWSMACVKGRLYVGAGPSGGLYRLEAGKLRRVWKSAEKHVMALYASGTVLYLGTAPEAKLFAFDTAKGRARLVYDFGGNEITSITGFGRDLYVAANMLKYTTVESSPTSQAKPAKPSVTKGTKVVRGKAVRLPYRHPVSGMGYLMRLTPEGAAVAVVQVNDGYVTRTFVHSGIVYVTTSGTGAVYAWDPVHQSVSRPLDFEQRQVLDLYLKGRSGLVLTGDKGAVYRIGPSVGKEKVYISKVFDASLPARFGSFLYRSSGPVRVETRSGMSEKPDDTWNPWKPLKAIHRLPSGLYSGRITSRPARYFQYRVVWRRPDKGMFDMARIFYSQVNLPPRILEVTVSPQDSSASSAKGAEQDSGSASPMPDGTAVRSSEVKISWTVDNPDEDTLQYRVWVRRIGQKIWFRLNQGKPVKDTSFQWQAGMFPDGLYVVRVQASDAPSNPSASVLVNSKDSEPFLVDNHPPVIKRITVKPNGKEKIKGSFVVSDSYSVIVAASFRIDNGPWMSLVPDDGFFDSLSESFSFAQSQVSPGYHLLQVRVKDEGGNIKTSTQQFRVK